MEYVRSERRPLLLEAMVSRLYGHSSSSGANFIAEEADCITRFEQRLEERKILGRKQMDDLRARITQELLEAGKRVREEPQPQGEDIWKHVFADDTDPRVGPALSGGPGAKPPAGGKT
jgi:2-oxoisovalerate dehydrogenase E1 component alpha subunit